MSNTYLKGNEIILQPREAGDNVQVNSLGDKEQRVNAELVTTHREASFDIHKPTNIEGNTHITGNLTVTGGLTSATPAIDNNRLVMNTDLNSIADSTLLPIKDPSSSPMAGWYINNAGGDKANYYFYGKSNLPEVHTLDELKYLYALVDIRAGGNLYLNVYTQRQNDGNDAGSWYRSRLNYIIGGSGSTATTGLSLLYVNNGEQPSDIFDSVQRVECLLDPFSSNGPQAGTENILTISIQSDSGAGAGTIEYVIQNVGFKLEHVIQNFMLITDNYSSEADIRTIVESYGYQDEAMVNALIASALVPYETSAEIDARDYRSEAQINALISTATADFETSAEIDARDYQSEAQVNSLISLAVVDFETSAEIDARGYLTQPEIQTLIDASVYVPNNYYFKAYLDSAGVSVNGQDTSWYLGTANNMVVREGGGNFAVDKYTLPEDGNYKVDVHLVAENFAHEFKTVVEALSAGDVVQEKFSLDWSSNAYGRHSSIVMPSSTAGKKIRVAVYNPSALGQNIVGVSAPVTILATPPPAYPQFGGTYTRVATGLMRNTSPPRQFIADPSGTPAGIYRYDDGVTTSYILYKLGNNYWYISNHTTATLDANLNANSNNWALIGDLLSAPNGYLGQNLNVSQTQSAGNVGGFYGAGVGAASWAAGSFSDPTAGTPEYNTHVTIHKV